VTAADDAAFVRFRERFPVLERQAYLNAGTFGPIARATADAVAAQQRRDTEDGRAGKAYFDGMLALRDDVRAKVAALVGAEPGRIALTDSTTSGCRIVLAGLGLQPDDEVVTTDAEHFGLIGPLSVTGARVRVAGVQGRPAAEALDAILAEVGPRTRLLALSHVVWTTGQVIPVAELRERTGLPLLVDGAQGAGAIEVDVGALGCDFYTISAQKWLCAPDATGALFVGEPQALRAMQPSFFSQTSYDLAAVTWEPRPDAARFDPGWIPAASLAGWAAALDDQPAWRFERSREMANRCRALLAGRGFEVVTEAGQANLVSWRPHGDAAETAARAYALGVVVRDLPSTGWLRASCGAWTSDEDLERLVDAVA
jgi:L-cysteine/cystine lyase